MIAATCHFLSNLFDSQWFYARLNCYRDLCCGAQLPLGFDAISTLSEESEGGGKAVSKATLLALIPATVLFIIVVTFAAFATGKIDSFAEGTETNEAFFTIAGDVGGIWLKVAFSIIVAFVCAVGNIITAQTAVSRVLFSMGRDKMLPHFWRMCTVKRKHT